MIVVSDASPLISFAAIGRLHLLQSIFGSVIIPQAVFDEIVAGERRPGAKEIPQATWIQVRKVKARRAVRQLMQSENLDPGESEAIVLARGLKPEYLLLADLAARRAAKREDLPVIGTLGVLVLAKTLKLIPAVKPCMRELLAAGDYIGPAVYQETLRTADELE
jgi:predicted nucleic acid-binding protein